LVVVARVVAAAVEKKGRKNKNQTQDGHLMSCTPGRKAKNLTQHGHLMSCTPANIPTTTSASTKRSSCDPARNFAMLSITNTMPFACVDGNGDGGAMDNQNVFHLKSMLQQRTRWLHLFSNGQQELHGESEVDFVNAQLNLFARTEVVQHQQCGAPC